jgi:hypothetical protein
MSENRIRKSGSAQSYGPGSVGVRFDTSNTPKYNPDGTERNLAPIVVRHKVDANSVDENVFIAPFACKLVRAQEAHSVVGGAGAQVDVKKCTGTTAPASGTSMLGSVFDLTSGVAVNTVTDKTLATSSSTLTLAAGDRVSLDFTGTLTGLVGVVTLTFVQV